ncbi:hypothetical protein ACHWQZ_G014238 [Mnemiopsis leidyi]
MSVSTDTSISGANPRQCTSGNLVNFEVVEKIWGTEVEMYFWATEIIIIGNREIETKHWRNFSMTNPLNLNVDRREEENYLVRFPCRNYIWLKLSLYGDGDSNSHVELYQNNMENGNIYCNKAGNQSWHGGEKTKFGIRKSWECEDDGENMILEIKKTSQYVKLKNRGNELFTKEFDSSDGNCYKQTKRITSQVWNYGGFLSLYLLSEKGQHCSTLNSTLDDYKMITDPLLPVNDRTNLTLSCSADYVNLENTTSTAECRNETVVATSKLPKCVKAQCKEKDTSWWNDVIMANLTLPLLHGQKVEISGCRNTDHILLGERVVTCNNGKLEPDPKCTQKESQDLRERIKGEIILISEEQSRTKYSRPGAENAIDGDLSTWSYAYPENTTGRAWLKIRLAEVSCISQVIVRKFISHATPDFVWNCSEQGCKCVAYNDGWCPFYNMSVSTETQDGYSISGATPRQCTSGNLVKFEVVKKIWGTEVEMFFWAREIIIIGMKKIETKHWRNFSKTNPLNLNVDRREEETYLVRFPCRNYIWFKLFLYGDGDINSHVELFQGNKENGNIYCNKAGNQSWYEGEKTEFGINKSWECEDDGENMILEIKKTTQFVKLKNRGNELYTKEFNSIDGNCYKQTKRITSQVWNYSGFLSLYLLSMKGPHCITLNSNLDDCNMITKPLLPVNDGTNMTLSCSAGYVNLENTTSTAECRNGTVVATSKLPKCVKGEVLTVCEEDEMW